MSRAPGPLSERSEVAWISLIDRQIGPRPEFVCAQAKPRRNVGPNSRNRLGWRKLGHAYSGGGNDGFPFRWPFGLHYWYVVEPGDKARDVFPAQNTTLRPALRRQWHRPEELLQRAAPGGGRVGGMCGVTGVCSSSWVLNRKPFCVKRSTITAMLWRCVRPSRRRGVVLLPGSRVRAAARSCRAKPAHAVGIGSEEPVSIHLHMRNPLAWHLDGRA
jgi:hypothetical protein